MDIEDINSNIITIEKQLKNLETFILTEENKLNKYEKIKKNIDDILSQYEDELNEEILTVDLENIKCYYNFQLKQETKLSEILNILIQEKYSTSFKIFL